MSAKTKAFLEMAQWKEESRLLKLRQQSVRFIGSQCRIYAMGHEQSTFWSFIYFTGTLEGWIWETNKDEAPDLVRSSYRVDDVAAGEWPAVVHRPEAEGSTELCSLTEAKEAIVFLWDQPSEGAINDPLRPWHVDRRGYIVAADDTERIEWVRKEMNKRKESE